MSSPISLEQTLRWHRLFKEGRTPQEIQASIVQKTQDTTRNVIAQLTERQELVESQIHTLGEKLKKIEPFSDIQEGIDTLEKTIDELKNAEELLEESVSTRQAQLEKQQAAKAAIKKTVNQYTQMLESTPPQHPQEQAIYAFGSKVTRFIGDHS